MEIFERHISIFDCMATRFLFIFISAFLALNLGASDKIVFVHIPKTGGVTVSHHLYNHYDLKTLSHSPPCLIAYGNHQPLATLCSYIDSHKFITFIRHPVSRILSEQRYCMEKHRGNPNILKAHLLDPTGDPIHTASNILCRMLSGLSYDDTTIPIERHLKAAKANLRSLFFFVGITEKMEDSLLLLDKKLGWDAINLVDHFNTTEKETTYPPEIIQEITNRNLADIELYEYALTLFEKEKELYADIPVYNPTYNTEISYTFDQPLQGYGWHGREFLNDEVFRWTTSKNESCLAFDLTKQSYQLHGRIYIQPALLHLLQVFINEIPVSLTFVRSKHSPKKTDFHWFDFSATITADLLHENVKTKVCFKMNPPVESALSSIFSEPTLPSVMDNIGRGKFALSLVELIP